MAKIEKPMILVVRKDICRNCQGDGLVMTASHAIVCYVCEGKGIVRVRKEIKTTIETI